ncbi:MAG: hypothetical protein WCA35_15595 [Kovacikia sp.]
MSIRELEGFQVRPAEVKRSFFVSEEFLRKKRYQGILLEGVHYIRIGEHKGILYNRPLIIDWMINRRFPNVHQRAIDNFLASLPSNQPRRKSGRKPAA